MPQTIAGNLILDNGKVLLLYRQDREYWELPAGKVNDDETPRQAAIREAAEEIGVTVQIKSSWSRGDGSFEHDETGDAFEARLFLSEIVDGTPEVKEEKFEELRWADEDALRTISLAPNLADRRDHLRLLLIRESRHRG